MSHGLYLGVLAACVLVTLPLEVVLGTRVYRRPVRLVLTLLPVLVVFVAWDSWAIHARWWRYAAHSVTGVRVGNVPVEELLFFVVVPVCAVLTWEAVGVVRERRR